MKDELRDSAPHSSHGKQIVVKDLSSDSLAIMLAADLSPAISSFVVDPGYSGDNDQRIRRVTNRTPSLLFAAFPLSASVDAVP